MDWQRQAYWKGTVHESGHGVSFWVLAGFHKVPERLVVFDGRESGSGLAYTGNSPRFDGALEAACGKAAEKLDCVRASPRVLPPLPILAERVSAPELGTLLFDLHCGPSDDYKIALFAIGDGCEGDEERWVHRARWIRRLADELVADYAGVILRVARALYEKRILLRPELEKLLPIRPADPPVVEAEDATGDVGDVAKPE